MRSAVCARQEVVERQLGLFDKVDEDYGRRVREAFRAANGGGAEAAVNNSRKVNSSTAKFIT